MNDTELNFMIEQDNARRWEEQNEEPKLDIESVILSLGEAYDSLRNSLHSLSEAANEAEGFPIEDRIWSVYNDMEDYQIDIDKLIDRLKEVKSA